MVSLYILNKDLSTLRFHLFLYIWLSLLKHFFFAITLEETFLHQDSGFSLIHIPFFWRPLCVCLCLCLSELITSEPSSWCIWCADILVPYNQSQISLGRRCSWIVTNRQSFRSKPIVLEKLEMRNITDLNYYLSSKSHFG